MFQPDYLFFIPFNLTNLPLCFPFSPDTRSATETMERRLNIDSENKVETQIQTLRK